MSEETSGQDERTLDSDWRARVSAVGKRNFENEEMLRLGFLSAEDLARIPDFESDAATYRRTLDRLAQVRRELAETQSRISELRDVDVLIAEIRARRIERVKADREVRRARRDEERIEREVRVQRQRIAEPTFLGRRVSRNLRFDGGDPVVLARHGLPVISSFMDLASALEITPQQLQWLTFERGAASTDHYTRFEIPKRSGGTRLISSPKPALRSAQSWVRESIVSRIPVGPAVMAFRPGVSIVDNARRHSGAAVVVRIDLKAFFPSITFDRVRGWFESLGYNPGVASVLALVCTDAPRAKVSLDGRISYVVVGERGLPQGACTSPDLANLIAAGLDARLVGLSAAMGWTYTRYADDLVFSSADTGASAARLVRVVTSIVGEEGFEVNEAKTRIMRSPNRQTVTGLLVNDAVRLTRKDLRRIRAFLHRCRVNGTDAVSAEIGRNARAVAAGYLAYVQMVMPDTAARMRAENTWI